MIQLSFMAVGLILILVPLAACTELRAREIREIPPAKALLVTTDAQFADAVPVVLGYRDSSRIAEYALFRAGGAHLELVYHGVTDPDLVLEFREGLSDLFEHFDLSRGRPRELGARGRLPTRRGIVFYLAYALTEAGRNCVIFLSEWSPNKEDDDRRPRKVLYGNYCAAAGAALPEERILQVIRRVGVREPVDGGATDG